MKTHLNLGTKDLSKSVAFYRTLLDTEPAKSFDDYALFITDDPGLELALDRNAHAEAGDSAHFGVVVDSAEAVDVAIARLQAAGYHAFLVGESLMRASSPGEALRELMRVPDARVRAGR